MSTNNTTSAPAGQPALARLLAINQTAAEWFTAQAASSKQFNAAVRDRGHDPHLMRRVGLGYAPDHPWTGLTTRLHAGGFTPEETIAAGLARQGRNARVYDAYRGRIMFPILNRQGRVAGFTGRDITGDLDLPKYLNTPTTAAFNKSELLYGTGHVTANTTGLVLGEGPWDALAVSAATRGGIVGLAACGTAVTTSHLDLVAAMRHPLCLAMDPDPAGMRALGDLTHNMVGLGQHPRAIALPPGTDLGDLHRNGGGQAVTDALHHAAPAGVTYADLYLRLNPPADTAEARVAAARAASRYAGGLAPHELPQLGVVLADRAGLSAEAVIPMLLAYLPPATPAEAITNGGPPRRPSSHSSDSDPPNPHRDAFTQTPAVSPSATTHHRSRLAVSSSSAATHHDCGVEL